MFHKNLFDFITYNSHLTTLSFHKTSTDTPVHEHPHYYRLVAIILDIGFHRVFKPVYVRCQNEEKRLFLPLSFVIIGLDILL